MKWISGILVFVALTVYERNTSFCIDQVPTAWLRLQG